MKTTGHKQDIYENLDFGRTVRRYQRGNQNANQRKTDNTMAKRKKDKRTSGDLQNNT